MCWNASILIMQYHLVGCFSNWLEERRLAEEEQLSPGKGQDSGLCPELLGALGPAAAPLRAEARQMLLCVLAEE